MKSTAISRLFFGAFVGVFSIAGLQVDAADLSPATNATATPTDASTLQPPWS